LSAVYAFNFEKTGLLFLDHAPAFRVYVKYLTNYNQSLAAYRICAAREPFQKFIKEQFQLPSVKQSTLESYLIMPVQRMPRYILLLEELRKNTEEQHPDLQHIRDALVEIKKITTEINKKTKGMDEVLQNLQILEEIQNSVNLEYQETDPKGLKKIGKSTFLLTAVHRRFLRKGPITIEIKILEIKKKKERRLFLFNDVLLLTKAKRVTFGFRKKYSLITFVDLAELQIKLVHSVGAQVCAFVLFFSDNSDGIITWAKTSEETNEWFQAINDAIASRHYITHSNFQ